MDSSPGSVRTIRCLFFFFLSNVWETKEHPRAFVFVPELAKAQPKLKEAESFLGAKFNLMKTSYMVNLCPRGRWLETRAVLPPEAGASCSDTKKPNSCN